MNVCSKFGLITCVVCSGVRLSPGSMWPSMKVYCYRKGDCVGSSTFQKRDQDSASKVMSCVTVKPDICGTFLYTQASLLQMTNLTELSSSAYTVMKLIVDLLDKGYCVVTDNFYSCPSLYRTLLGRKTDAFGTVKLRRKGMPPYLKKAKLKKR